MTLFILIILNLIFQFHSFVILIFCLVHLFVFLRLWYVLIHFNLIKVTNTRLIYFLSFEFDYLFFRYLSRKILNHFETLFFLFEFRFNCDFSLLLVDLLSILFNYLFIRLINDGVPQVHSIVVSSSYHDQNLLSVCQILPFLFISILFMTSNLW